MNRPNTGRAQAPTFTIAYPLSANRTSTSVIAYNAQAMPTWMAHQQERRRGIDGRSSSEGSYRQRTLLVGRRTRSLRQRAYSPASPQRRFSGPRTRQCSYTDPAYERAKSIQYTAGPLPRHRPSATSAIAIQLIDHEVSISYG